MSRGRIAIALSLALAAATAAAAAADTALFTASRAGDAAAVGARLAAGADPDARDRYGTTALAMAAGGGHREAVETLLDAGADPDVAETFYGSRPLDAALFNGHLEVASLLLARGAEGRETALEIALAEGDLELARAAVAGGPIHDSALAAARAAAAELEPAFAALLAGAASRPDPPRPAYDIEGLHRFTGLFEGFDSDTRLDVVLREGELRAALDGGAFVPLALTGERAFAAVDGAFEATFFGRAGTLEGLRLARPGAAAVGLRRSVAEPAPQAAERFVPRAHATAPRTVHWPAFRGANASGIGDGVEPPLAWDLARGEGLLWEAPIPGLGNSSPVVWGERVFVTTAVAPGLEQRIETGLTGAGRGVDEPVEHSWRVLAFDKRSGELLWETEVGRAVPRTRRHFKASQASPTPATDGRHLVAVFPTAGIACLDLDGTIRWQRDLGALNAGAFSDPTIEWGFASSPVIHDGKAILQVDVHGGAYLAAWDLATGRELWRTERRVAPSWATPTVLATANGTELVANGSTIYGYDPDSGRELWSLGPNSELVIATPVAGAGVVYVSAGYPPVKPIYAVAAGARGELEVEPGARHPALAWSAARGGAYMPTPLLYRGLFYVVHHNGRIVAYDAASGEALMKSRFSRGGVFTASPVAANGRLYLPTEEGLVYVLAAGPEYRELAVNDVGEPLMATPAISEGILFLRTPRRLLALGTAPAASAGF